MRAEELKDAVRGICMTEEQKRAVIRSVKAQREDYGKVRRAGNGVSIKQDRKAGSRKHRKDHRTSWQKSLAAAAAVLVVIGVAAVPVRAFVNSLVRERMEEMPKEEKETYEETLKEQRVAADGFSRAYTRQEEARYQELAQKYQEGTFPAQEVPQAENEEEAAGYEFCYLVPASTFCLPERELTDEEMLEIIDFLVKREYAHTESYASEHAQEIAKEEAKEQAAIDENVEGGGITQQEAVEIGRQKLKDIFDMTPDGFEQNAYYNEPEEDRGANYCVNWSNNISHKYYYFHIDARDGHLIRASHSFGTGVYDTPWLTMEEAQDQTVQLQKLAAEVMQDKVGVPYDKVYVYYLQYEDGTAGNYADFYFAGADQSAYKISYTWSGILCEIEETDISTLRDGEEEELWNGDSYDKATAVFRELPK